MRISKYFLLLLLFLLMSFPSQLLSKDAKETFTIIYHGGFFLKIEVKDGKLHLEWHQEIKQPNYYPDNPEIKILPVADWRWDRFEANIWLTPDELNELRDWLKQSNIFQYNLSYKPGKAPRDRYIHFPCSLLVTLDEKSHKISWLNPPKSLKMSLNRLRKICSRIRKDRESDR